MQKQFKVIKAELSKGKSTGKVATAADELQQEYQPCYCQDYGTLEWFVFVSMANLILAM